MSSSYEKPAGRLCQGAVFRGVVVTDGVFIVPAADQSGESEIQTIQTELPYAVMLSQDCDLEWDDVSRAKPGLNQDKYLQAMLVCPAYPALQLKEGKHLESQSLKMVQYSSEQWRLILRNGNERYHYLASEETWGVPELVLDFKHYRTVPRQALIDLMKSGGAIAALRPLFRERLSQRFANYLSRIGLPEEAGVLS